MAERVIKLFGEPEVTVNGAQVRLGTALPLLAVLLLWRGRDEIRVEDAAEVLHPDHEDALDRADGAAEPRAASFLRKRKTSLRQKLGLGASGGQTLTDLARSLPAECAWVDVVRFDEASESDDPVRLREAVALRGRGPLLAGWEPSALSILPEERRAREQKYQRALVRLIDIERRDRPWEALRLLDLLLTADGVSDKRAAELQELRAALGHEAAHHPAPPLPAHNLPARVSAFIGRGRETAAVRALLAEKRLVTLTGSGGCGKSRLALKVATEEVAAWRDNVRLVELAPVADPSLVPWAVALAFALPDQKGRSVTDLLIEYLRPRQALLLLDNCEYLTDACAMLVERLLLSCPALSVLATSREPLDIDGEKLCRVLPLDFPDPGNLPFDAPDPVGAVLRCDAVRLFCDRVGLHTEFALGCDTLLPVAVVCQRLDGIPLALELAAARVGELSVAEVAAQLDDRFGLLTKGRRTALPHHATLRAAMDWSYDLLREEERDLLCRLSVFAGGWTREAAEAIVSDWEAGKVSRLLASLTRRSLISAEPEDAPQRYRMLETVREYAQERLKEREEWDDTRRQHRGFYLGLAAEADPLLKGPDQNCWLNTLEREHDNLRAALEFCRERPQAGDEWMRLVACLWWFWWVRGYIREGRSHLAAALARSRGETVQARIRALEGAGNLAQHQGDYDEAQTLLEQGLALQRERGDVRGTASLLGSLGNLAHNSRRYAEAYAHHWESLGLFRGLSDDRGVAVALLNLGNVAFEEKRFCAARERFQESRDLFAKSQDERGVALSLYSLGNTAREQGSHSEAAALLGESLRLFHSRDDQWSIVHLLESFASLSAERRQGRSAATLWGASELFRERLGTPIPVDKRDRYEQELSRVRKAIGEQAFTDAWAGGRAMTWEQAMECALQEAEIGTIVPSGASEEV